MADEQNDKKNSVTRRDFARGAAITAAAMVAFPAGLVAQTQTLPPTPGPEPQTPPAPAPKLSPASQAEAEAKLQNIFRKYGNRLSDAERADIRKTVLAGQEPLEKLRAYPLENGNEPATVLRAVVEETK